MEALDQVCQQLGNFIRGIPDHAESTIHTTRFELQVGNGFQVIEVVVSTLQDVPPEAVALFSLLDLNKYNAPEGLETGQSVSVEVVRGANRVEEAA